MKELNDSVASINREKFEVYEELKRSGTTNMANLSVVQALTNLTRAEVMKIQRDYLELKEKYDQ